MLIIKMKTKMKYMLNKIKMKRIYYKVIRIKNKV